MKKIYSIINLIVLLFAASGNMVFAGEATGNLSTGVSTGIDGTVMASPVANPAGQSFSSSLSVELTSSAPYMCYTTDNTTPSCEWANLSCTNGTKYSSLISISSTKTIKSIACYAGGENSGISTDTYTKTSGGGGGGGGGGGYTPICLDTQLECKLSGDTYKFTKKVGVNCRNGNLGKKCIIEEETGTGTGTTTETGEVDYSSVLKKAELLLDKKISEKGKTGEEKIERLKDKLLLAIKNYLDNKNSGDKKLLSEKKYEILSIYKEFIKELNKKEEIIIDKGSYTLKNNFSECNIIDNVISDNYLSNFVTKFSDINTNEFKNYIISLEKVGVVTGDNKGNFNPKNKITRSEFLLILLRLHCIDFNNVDTDNFNTFIDVDNNTWQAKVIKKATDMGIINGYINEKGKIFQPNKFISKSEALAILMRMSGITLKEDFESRYKDKFEKWQKKYVNIGVYLNIFDDSKNKYFNPNTPINRDFMAYIFVKMVEKYR